MTDTPNVVAVFSGKRKSGKDYITELIQQAIGIEKCSIMRLSAPLKGQYAKENNLDFSKLLDASEYKEKYRADMIKWGEEKRNKDPSFFCRLTTQGPESLRQIWIISDARRVTDMEYFVNNYGSRTVKIRVVADEDVRKSRDWEFVGGIDDAESECGLDSWTNWDFVVENNGDSSKLSSSIEAIMKRLTCNTS